MYYWPKLDELPRAVRIFGTVKKMDTKPTAKKPSIPKRSGKCSASIKQLQPPYHRTLRNDYVKVTGGNKYRQGFDTQVVKLQRIQKSYSRI